MRAALGLPNAVAGLDDAYYFQQAAQQQQQQQQRRQELQRELHLRQLLLQEQMDQQLQEQQLRAIGEQLQDFPDLQQHYQSLLQSQRRNSGFSGTAMGGIAAGAAHQLTAVQQQQQATLLREQRLRAYEERLLFQQQQRQLAGGFHQGDTAQLITAVAARQQRHQHMLPTHPFPQNLVDVEALMSPLSPPVLTVPLSAVVTAQAAQLPVIEQARSFGHENEHSVKSPSRKRSASEQIISCTTEKSPTNKKQTKKKGEKVKGRKKKQRKGSPVEEAEPMPHEPDIFSSSSLASDSIDVPDPEGVFEAFAMAVDMVSPDEITQKGSFDDLLIAADDCDQLDDAAMILTVKFSEVKPWSDSDVGEGTDETVGLKIPTTPAESIATLKFKSALPSLPEEPVFLDVDQEGVLAPDILDDESEKELSMESKSSDPKEYIMAVKKAPLVLDYPYPIDTWWPSINGMRRERKNCGETSDEDNFEEDTSPPGKTLVFRANARKIRNRLSRSLQPGVLEKLPHCRIHRKKTKRKKNSTAPELVYCWQVTEIYPNEIMVNCSRCGTWRHAACGGHHKPYSTRENTSTPFVAVCENCHEEDMYLKEFPHGEQRIERQRIEQLRRGLATSAVMRHSSYSKHGGTYKWPLGSVSATHIGGHTRSVHARHDKAEKQWNDMAARLGRGYGYRPKERVRSRTKELERLLVAIEDAEGFTDRHNMFLFLHRDTGKEKPPGFKDEIRNIFDPADNEVDTDELGLNPQMNGNDSAIEAAAAAKDTMSCDEREDENDATEGATSFMAAPIEMCVRSGCERRQRFDSRFCSDACGVATLEMNLLRTLQDASDIHPSVLRL